MNQEQVLAFTPVSGRHNPHHQDKESTDQDYQ
jgi:hypothetical protein